ncbi:cbb3-type cytochrome oxidase assembly protein CcoS [Luteimonas marina]|uniref:cbb3-type cytochrome oxidase assembly protein CcoS n=1 Tax=Luteimonas marina TaxID=488485 RepID=UPI00307D1469
MRSLLLLVPISLVLLGVAIWAFVWAVRRGQFDDLDTPALDILADDGDEDEQREHDPSSPRRRGPSVVAPRQAKTLGPRLRGDDDPYSDPSEATTTTQRYQGAGTPDAD